MLLSRPPRNPFLAPFVEALWVHQQQLPHRYERVLPSGRLQLLVNLQDDQLCDYTLEGRPANETSGAALQGARSAPMVIATAHQQSVCGISFAHGGAWPFLGVPADELGGRVLALSDLWGRAGQVLRERLLEARDPASQLDVLEAALLERATWAYPRWREVRTACVLLADSSLTVGAVGHRLGLTPRRLIELFRTHVGVGPKTFARMARFQAVLRAIDGAPRWAELAAAHGFSDQSHMIREFREFAGSSPGAHRARSVEAPNHVPLSERQFSSIRGPGRRTDSSP